MRTDLPGRIALLLVMLLGVGCTSTTNTNTDNKEAASQALVAYFDALHQGDYARADALYGGSYEALTSMNPDLDPADHTALWTRGCTQNGFHCLAARTVDLVRIDGNMFFFQVQFTAPDGSLFIMGPCCGATETEMPKNSIFDYTVVAVDGRYQVMDLPVFTP